MSESLYNKLIEYSKNGKYPLHMPGHKRNKHLFADNIDPYDIDITEITDFDDLHHADGIILEVMKNAADFFGTKKTWFLVNGSSCGLLSAISAVTNIGDNILIGRNCHKSIYNICQLKNLKVDYIYPDFIEKWGINGGYSPEKIEYILKKAREQKKDVKAVVITSPTYEGILSDIEKIAEIVHRYNSVLIVDEAHGAHLGISKKWPVPAYKQGADIVIESAHKTLPAMTQTAFLHMGTNRVDSEKIQKNLSIFQSSSPSYVLMASIDKCVRQLQKNGQKKYDEFLNVLDRFYDKTKKLKNIKVLSKNDLVGNCLDFDKSKLVIFSLKKSFTGKDLEKVLREKYNYELEMTSLNYTLAMTSVCDDFEKIEQLADALIEIDNCIERNYGKVNNTDSTINENYCESSLERNSKSCKNNRFIEETDGDYEKMEQSSFEYCCGKSVMTIYEATISPTEEIPLEKSLDRVAADYVYVYPPEVPIVVPGEIITENLINMIRTYISMGLNIKGVQSDKIQVVKSPSDIVTL